MDDRNGYRLTGRLARRGYDWWWHSLTAVDRETGEPQPFFVAYFVINPALGGATPVLGQSSENQARRVRPSYAMLKAGTWAPGNAVQIHGHYGIDQFSVESGPLRVRIGANELTDTHLRGAVCVTCEEAAAFPERMSDPGELSWDLRAEKVLSYGVGFGASPLFRWLNAFEMYWHVQGMLTRYTGEIRWNGRVYDVASDTSAGYQDKNWGQDYTRLWVWLNCNRFVSRTTGERLPATSLVVGGAEPVLWGLPLPRRVLVALHHKGRLYEVNFSKLWTLPRQRIDCGATDGVMHWRVEAWTRRTRIRIDFACPQTHMQLFHYENPDGKRLHRQLWNGGWASGTVTLYERYRGGERLIDVLDGTLGGCEYGEASPA